MWGELVVGSMQQGCVGAAMAFFWVAAVSMPNGCSSMTWLCRFDRPDAVRLLGSFELGRGRALFLGCHKSRTGGGPAVCLCRADAWAVVGAVSARVGA